MYSTEPPANWRRLLPAGAKSAVPGSEMREAIAFHLEGLREAGVPVPAPKAVSVDLIAA